MTRGILSSCYARLRPGAFPSPEEAASRVREIYADFYAGEPFVKISQAPPQTKQTLGSNMCLLYPTVDVPHRPSHRRKLPGQPGKGGGGPGYTEHEPHVRAARSHGAGGGSGISHSWGIMVAVPPSSSLAKDATLSRWRSGDRSPLGAPTMNSRWGPVRVDEALLLRRCHRKGPGRGTTRVGPQLQGCYAQGESYEEALENIRDVIKLIVEDMEASGEAVPDQHSVSLITLEVAV